MRNTIYGFILLQLLLVTFVHSEHRKSINKGNIGNEEITIEPIVGPFSHGEGPHWDHRAEKLYFVDIVEQKICSLNPTPNTVACTYIESGPVGVAVPVYDQPDKFVAGVGKDFTLVTWDGQSNITKTRVQTLAVVDAKCNGNRWNDGKVDSSGRFWGGTIGPEVNEVVIPDHASFYRIASDLKPVTIIPHVTNSNGLAWNLEDNKFYYIDTPTLQIAAYDYNPHAGTISNKRIAFDLAKNNITGLPDGMTIDTNGNLWIALYNGGGVVNANPTTGEVIRFISLPVKKVTSVAFGGPLLKILYITTSSRGLTEAELKNQPHAGYIFAVKGLGVHGLLANSFHYNS